MSVTSLRLELLFSVEFQLVEVMTKAAAEYDAVLHALMASGNESQAGTHAVGFLL